MKPTGYEIDGAIQHAWRQCVDGGFSISFHTPELSMRFVELLLGANRNEGKLLFAPSGADDLITNESSERGRKEAITKSQRLRMAIMERWQKAGTSTGEFDDYYDRFMDAIIARVLAGNVYNGETQ